MRSVVFRCRWKTVACANILLPLYSGTFGDRRSNLVQKSTSLRAAAAVAAATADQLDAKWTGSPLKMYCRFSLSLTHTPHVQRI